MAKFDPKWLAGIKFSTAETRKVDDGNGNEVARNFPVKLDAAPEHVLDWADKGATVVIVMKDGKKYTVDKASAAKAAKTDPPSGSSDPAGSGSGAGDPDGGGKSDGT